LRPRPKNEAMLRGNGGVRTSKAEVRVDVRGCDLHAGPDRSYLDGANMRFMESE
jgi:hypothetical protein